MTNNRKQWYLIGGLAALTAIAALALVITSWRTLLITWHRKEQTRYAAQWKQDLQGTPEMQEVSRQGNSHRDELVRLGALVRKEYILQHRLAPADYRPVILKLIARQRTGLQGDWSSPVAYTPTPMCVTVWCPPPDLPTWDAFIQSLDLPAAAVPVFPEN